MTRREAVQAIYDTDGRFFAVEFKKRSDGSLRVMNARLHVKKHLSATGNGRAYQFEEYGLIPCFDVAKGQYRVIPTEGITRLKVDGDWLPVE